MFSVDTSQEHSQTWFSQYIVVLDLKLNGAIKSMKLLSVDKLKQI